MNVKSFKKFLDIKSPILITGPTGTGKSQLAQKFFRSSTIYKEKFLTVHLATLKEDLLESELFGHKKGSFTGAIDNKNGYLKDVGKGTLFLDEIGELSLSAQKKLLYLLEEKKFTPVGSTTAQSFEGRLIMATNRDLKAMVKNGEFREDLFFRLSVFHIALAPIHTNKENLRQEIERLFEMTKKQYDKTSLLMSGDVFNLLMSASWKGNYRELKNCLEFAIAWAEGAYIEKSDLPQWFLEDLSLSEAHDEANFISHFPEDFNEALENFEKWYLKAMLTKFNGRVNEASRMLGLSKTTLIAKARKYQINTMQLRAEASAQKTAELVA